MSDMHDSYGGWYDEGPGSESFKRTVLVGNENAKPLFVLRGHCKESYDDGYAQALIDFDIIEEV